MDVLLIVFAVSLALFIQHWLTRRKLDELSNVLDTIMAENYGRELDFFRSQRMRNYLSNSGYAEVLRRKAEKLKASIAESQAEPGS